jgi:hypothetical protein
MCLWLRSATYEYALMSPFGFFKDFWNYTLAGYLASACQIIPLQDPAPSWWPEEKISVWHMLKQAHRFSLLPAIRRQVAGSMVLTRPGLQPFQPERTGRAPTPIGPEPFPRLTARGKRRVAPENESNALVALPSDSGGEQPIRGKRSRFTDADSLRNLMDESLVLDDSYFIRMYERQGMWGGNEGIKLPVNKDAYQNPWNLSVPNKAGAGSKVR